MRTRITDSDRVKLENSEVFVAFRIRSKLGILTDVNVKPKWSMCRNLLCSAITASIPVRRLFSMDGRPPNQGSGYLASPDVVTMEITEWQGAYTR